VFVLEADSGCGLALDAIASVGLDAQPYYVGACAATPILDEAGPAKTEGARFNIEQELSGGNVVPDTDLYFSVVGRYGDGFEAGGAGTVSFRSFMNLYLVLRSLDAVSLDSASITAALRSQRDAPSFMGHSYTCDGRQFGTLTAFCSPQQILVELSDGELTQLGDWIDVGEIMTTAGAGTGAG
jgi:branched-chain amino acid transport system substrate-binding protein